MRWFASRGAGDPSAADSVEETPAESVQTVTIADDTEASEAATEVDGPDDDDQPTARHIRWSQAIVFVVLPALALLLASAAGFLKWQDGSAPRGRGGPPGFRGGPPPPH